MSEINKETLRMLLQGITSVGTAICVIASGRFQSWEDIIYLGAWLLIAIFIFFKLIAIRTEKKAPSREDDKISRVLTWIAFVWFGAVLGWIILVILKFCFAIWSLLGLVAGMANSQ